MKFGIIGPGALGTYLAGLLSKENEVHLIGHKGSDIKEIEITGLTELNEPVDHYSGPKYIEDSDCVIICTKSYDTEKAIKDVSPYLGSDTYVLSLQNGLDNEKIISRYVNGNKVVGGITGIGITYLEPGRIKHAGSGVTYIGLYPEGEDAFVDRLAEIFNGSGIETDVTDNVYGHIWKKVIINSGINPITALTGLKNGEILEIDEVHPLFREVCEESTEVALKDTELPEGDPVEEAIKVAELTSDNKSSMLQDVQNMKKTEIECINGAVQKVGNKLGVETPYNRVLTALIKAKEKSYL